MKKSIAIIGGGSAAMMLAAQLNENKFEVTIYERNAALGRKFLVAGDGGFNLTHSEEIGQFISRYQPITFMEPIIRSFTNVDLRNWFSSIGIETIVGSSKRVFPTEGIKPIDVLNAILKVLKKKNVSIQTQHNWKGWKGDELIFEANGEIRNIKAESIIFALGGGSWKVTGSDGAWINYFKEKGITTVPFQSSNCAFEIKWSREFLKVAEGQSLKNISLKCNHTEKKGEVVVTAFGLEGGAVYALSADIRKQLNEQNTATVFLDLKPAFTLDQVKTKTLNRGNKSLSQHLESELNLDKVQLQLLKSILSKEEFTNIELISEKIKNLPLSITAPAPIDEAISTVGGVALPEIDQHFQLKKLPDHYVIGEMLDWDAPTGGYLLQACFSMGYCLGEYLNTKN